MTGDRDQGAPRPDHSASEADQRFVESLLHQHFHADPAANQERLARALRELIADPRAQPAARPPAGPGSSWWSTAGRWTLAAGTLLTLGLIPFLLSDSATAAIARSIRAMSQAIDFHYELQIESRLGPTVRGEVWIRGTERAAVRLGPGPDGLWLGEGRSAGWIVPMLPVAPVVVVERGKVLENLPANQPTPLPFLHFNVVLEQLDANAFDVGFGADEQTIEARPTAGSPQDAPTRVSLRITAEGVVRELVVRWEQEVLRPKQVTLRWLDQTPMPESFYEHEAHHDGRRVVDRR